VHAYTRIVCVIPIATIYVDMLRRIREFGPVVLIPAAWIAAGAAVTGSLSEEGVLIAHLVMASFIAFFAVTGWNEMEEGALRAWRLVLVAGFGVTVAGIAGFVFPPFAMILHGTSLLGWMLLPAAGLAYTALEIPDARIVYGGGAALSVLGAGLFVVGLGEVWDLGVVLGFVFVCIGQTSGILDAARR
jgi:hypothetical protein